MPSGFYVYEHRKKTTGEVFYVGKGQQGRAWFVATRSKHWKNVARKYGVDVRIIIEGIPESYAHQVERELIALYGRADLGLGPLINLTDGGEGKGGAFFSEETRKKMSAKKAGKKPHPNAIAAVKSESTRAKMSLAKKGKPVSAAALASKKIAMNRPEVKEKLRVAQAGRVTQAQLIASRARHVMCVETGMTFVSLGEAERWVRSIGNKTSPTSIWRSCVTGYKRAGGFHWKEKSPE